MVELETLQAAAKPLGLFVGQHRECCAPDACYYVEQFSKCGRPGLKFATAEQVRAFLAFFTLRRAAQPLGFYVGEHKHFDPSRGGGPFFLMRRKEQPDQRMPMLLRYATAEMVKDFLSQQAEEYAT